MGMSFENVTSDAYLASVIFVPYAKSYVGLCYNGIQLYVTKISTFKKLYLKIWSAREA